MESSIIFFAISCVVLIVAISILYILRHKIYSCIHKISTFLFKKPPKAHHSAVPAEQFGNDSVMKNSELKLEDVTELDKKEEALELNFNDFEVNVDTAKESKRTMSEKEEKDEKDEEYLDKKIQIEFSRVEDNSKVMVTE